MLGRLNETDVWQSLSRFTIRACTDATILRVRIARVSRWLSREDDSLFLHGLTHNTLHELPIVILYVLTCLRTVWCLENIFLQNLHYICCIYVKSPW